MLAAESFEAKFDLFEGLFDAEFAGVDVGEKLPFFDTVDDVVYLLGALNQAFAQLGEEPGEQAPGC